jgi:catechol 2,3-dioxygenase-like lactoylglutathione lyase family enzyme
MTIQLTHANIWVHDQDEALAFYTEKLGLEIREDVTLPELGGYRWLTVGPVGQPDVAFTLNVPGPPMFDPATTEQLKDVMAKGAAGGFILGTEDCRASYEELKARGVEFTE